ncbi:LysR family transcriptional regulator [Rhodanobacter sp. AS-Z3]|uniref:LysR family transcriptional regulator n=1 Tax=Rhodanobacter sp. AS-Z3 TaxID=3031330 RepID=UPI00247A0054|nr:LysR family transcriptional regulator [Rhodanobacter sp. AS-Z3]WEN15699.1 LysR family transcriptional regulator [Rhodanobacter sp. AS-Z3]
MAGLNYNHLRYFWAVAREGNLTRTAEKLLVSQSALSIQIKKLETQLGHDLFERTGRQLLLTEAGRIAFDHAETIFAGGAELLATLNGRREERRSILRVGALATLSRNFQIGFLRPLLSRENVEVIVRSGTTAYLLQSLEAHRLDVVLVNVAPPRDAATPWISHPIAEQPVSLIGTPARIGKGGTLASLLTREPLVLPTMESSVRIGFDALIDRMGLRVRVAAEVDDMAMMRLLAREDIGVAVVPPIVVKDELASGLLVEVHQLPQLSETFFAVTLKRRFPNPLLRALLEPDAAGEWLE